MPEMLPKRPHVLAINDALARDEFTASRDSPSALSPPPP